MAYHNIQDERELIERQAQLARVKVAASYLKQRQEQAKQSELDSSFNYVLSTFSQATKLSSGLPSNKLLWNTIFLPMKWQNRIWVAIGLLAWQMWVNKPNKRY